VERIDIANIRLAEVNCIVRGDAMLLDNVSKGMAELMRVNEVNNRDQVVESFEDLDERTKDRRDVVLLTIYQRW
jgi:hypothetical protein